MNRDDMLAHVQDEASWDFIIVGGGATGLGVAVDAASRGYKTLLLEMSDFAKATSSRSTKLVHGGVRYLQQGNISLVLEALKERGLLRQNAPHLVKDLSFVVPNYDWWEGPYYGIGMKLYDLLAGKYGFGRSKNLSREETLTRIPTVNPDGLVGGVIYHDGQFDDARLAVNMAQTAVEQGATLINYMKVNALTKRDGEVRGVIAHDLENDKEYEIDARVVINAAGIFSDDIRQMDNPDAPGRMQPSQGIHIVLDRSYLPGDSAIMVPKTDDGRVLFAVPWHDVIIVGTTDTPIDGPSLEPKPLDEEIDFVLEHTQRYLRSNPTRDDLLSVFAGIRPLVSESDTGDTSKISREHQISISPSGLLTIAGGKWTTYRNMAEDTVDQAILLSGLDEEPCVTKTLQLHGYHQHAEEFGDLALYGSDAPALRELMHEDDSYTEKLHDDHPVKAGQVVWAVRHEMARTVDDFLSRRTRVLLLDARASMEMAPKVAEIMADELGHDEAWQKAQVQEYRDLAQGYLA
ncbi:MAG: FAD-dependent oxidoreductase [Bacteroidetes bacterium]|jgi:glycerol-3-phosphate dehydrogenase|nr:FAD-dependent oxidoreductase [Bacteroidota bacterium]